jgi:hypothetical protein
LTLRRDRLELRVDLFDAHRIGLVLGLAFQNR